MATDLVAYRGRGDSVGLNEDRFSYGPSSPWTQAAGGPFRLRVAVSGTGTVGGQLEFSTNGTAFTNVTDVSGTVQAARSDQFADGASTSALLTDPADFTAGRADERDGAVSSVTLASQKTELEFCVQLVPADITAGGTIYLRVADLDAYTRTPRITVGGTARGKVRLKVGDTDEANFKLTDAQVDLCIADWPDNADLAAANAAEAIAAKYAEGFNFSEDGQTFNRRERVEHYMDLAKELRRRGGALVWPTS